MHIEKAGVSEHAYGKSGRKRARNGRSEYVRVVVRADVVGRCRRSCVHAWECMRVGRHKARFVVACKNVRVRIYVRVRSRAEHVSMMLKSVCGGEGTAWKVGMCAYALCASVCACECACVCAYVYVLYVRACKVERKN